LEALTAGPLAVLGQAAEGLPTREIAVGQPAHLTWFDPAISWSPDTTSWLSLGANTPYWGQRLRGVVLGTFVRGRSAYLSRSVAPEIGIV
jgi:dihydroorotase